MKYCIVILLLLVAGCSSDIPKESGSLEVYFCSNKNCTDVLFMSSSHCAIYDYNPSLISSLSENNISIVIDSDNYEGYGKSISEKGLMHHKFCVFEDYIVTGSFNPTIRGDNYNDNNLLKIKSKYLAENYETEYQNLWKSQSKATPYKKIIFNGFLIENYFCPRDNCKKRVLNILEQANESIYFMIFSFTDDEVGDLLVEKSQTIEVRGIMEKKQDSKYSEFEKLNSAGIDVLWDNNPYTMHHKVFIVDKHILISGSYNPTKNANENNRENIIIIHNSIIAETFIQEFAKLSLA